MDTSFSILLALKVDQFHFILINHLEISSLVKVIVSNATNLFVPNVLQVIL
jgi:hypothetical protein